MGIKYLVLFLVLTYAVFASEGETTVRFKERTDDFIKNRLIPALKQRELKKFNYERLHLCRCSTEGGCTERTKGWVPSVGELLTEEERKLYENTCYTDGFCYQNARPSPEISSFGCMDITAKRDNNDFHITAASMCKNSTEGNSASVWICCNRNFCANETLVYLPPVYSFTRRWLLPSLIIVIVLLIICATVICLNRKSLLPKVQLYVRYRAKRDNDEEMDEMESELEPKTSHRNQLRTTGEDRERIEDGCTISTSLGTTSKTGAEDSPDNLMYMMLALDETTGSGAGRSKLHQVTMGKQIKLLEKIGYGRFGNVTKGDYRGETVAVKIFNALDEAAFHNEVEIYETSMLRHSNILRYIGSDRVDTGYATELWLITEYHRNGSLHDFLEHNVVDIPTFYQLVNSIAVGLWFLHVEYEGTRNSSKASIAHRDIKSRNIMVRDDLSCAIGDLGLSLALPLGNSTGRIVSAPNPKCGTVRYLAPEILDGTMQSTVFESYLMADIYAFSLVIWEVLSRCQDGDVVARSAGTSIPYIEYTTRDPTDEQMKDVVCLKKFRPSENPAWRKHSELKHVVEIMTSCWSENPTARYTAYQCKMRLGKRRADWLDESARREEGQTQLSKTVNKTRDGMTWPTSNCRKVHDQETVENRNGQCFHETESSDPLLG